jgi:uncharacterized membrane protein
MKENQRNKNNNNSRINSLYSPILPPLSLLESYEELSPGITGKLADLARLEQQHRHKIENHYAKILRISFRTGQFLGFIVALVTLYYTYQIGIASETRDPYLASVVCISGFSFLMLPIIFSFLISRNQQKAREASQRIRQKQ